MTNTSVTSFEELKDCPRLTTLIVTDTPIDDAGLCHLEGLQGLMSLTLQRTRVADRGVECLRHLPSLESFDLSGSRLSDKGLRIVCSFPAIQDATLTDTAITDLGLAGVADSLNRSPCTYLGVSGPGVTKRGIDELRAKLTHTTVVWRVRGGEAAQAQ